MLNQLDLDVIREQANEMAREAEKHNTSRRLLAALRRERKNRR